MGVAGATAYASAASFQRARHDGGVSLDPRFRAALRPQFGDLVDRVQMHYSATQLDAIRVGGHTFSNPSAGQTFGLDIYLNMSEADAPLSLIAHELHHTRQWVTRGESLDRFGESYFAKWCEAGFRYAENGMERDAEEVANHFPSVVLAQLPAPGRPVVNGGGLCLDVHGPDMQTPGGHVQLWSCNGGVQQEWNYDGTQLVNGGGLCLDAHAPDAASNGGRVQVWPCNSGPQQQWRRDGDHLVNGYGLCLDAHFPDMERDGAHVQVWSCSSGPNQSWAP